MKKRGINILNKIIKRGFTLVELLAVIVIMGVLITIVSINILNVLTNKTDSEFEIVGNLLEESAKVYVELENPEDLNTIGNTYCVTIRDLYDKGLIYLPVINHKDGSEYPESTCVYVLNIGEEEHRYSFDEMPNIDDINSGESTVPTITLLGENPITMMSGGTFTDPGATATDETDGNLTSSIQVSSNVNTNVGGTYTVIYSVINSFGKIATVSRNVIVEVDPIMDLIQNHNYLPVSTVTDLNSINSSTSRTWGAGTPYSTVGVGGMNKNYIQLNNINIGGAFTPIGFATGYTYIDYSGTFDGNNFKITNGTITNVGESFMGLFARITGTVKNLGLEGWSISGSSYLGILSGGAYGATVDNVYATGTVHSNDGTGIGGLIGIALGTVSLYNEITNSYSTANLTGAFSYAGGLIGWGERLNLSNSYATGNVTRTIINADSRCERVGGLVGWTRNGGLINRCYATGAVMMGTQTGGYVCTSGGLVGQSGGNARVWNSYATGNVSGDQVGGLFGMNFGDDAVTDGTVNNYSTGLVTLSNPSHYFASAGGMIGQNGTQDSLDTPEWRNPTVTGSYYNSTTSGRSDNVGKGIPRTTAQMRTQSTFVGWDFTTIWRINAGVDYPRLRWQP